MTLSPAQLRIDVQEPERWRRTLSVTVPAEAVRKERDRAVKRLAGRLKLPGFRKGKVPAAMVEKQYGSAVNQETLDRVIEEACRMAVAERALHPISELQLEDVDYRPQADLTFRISFDIRPSIEISRLSDFKVERPRIEVTEAQIAQVLERLRDRSAVWRTVDDGMPPLDGDLVSVTIARLEDGGPVGEPQGYQLVIGEGDAIPDVEAAIRTLAPGQTGDFTVLFPADFSDPARRGDQELLRITVVDRRMKEPPALDDAFARSVGEFDDLDALRASLRRDLEEEVAVRADTVATVRLLDAVMAANPFEVPRSMVERYIDSVMGDTTDMAPDRVARAREQIRPDAELGLKRLLLVDRIAELRELGATEEEFDARVAEMAEGGNVTPPQARAELVKTNRIESLKRELTERKVFTFLREQSEIHDEQ